MLALLTILPTAAAADAALTYTALRVLIAAPAVEWAPISVAALARELHRDPSTVYRAIRTLHARGYLLRRVALPGEFAAGPRTVYRVNLLRYPSTERSVSA